MTRICLFAVLVLYTFCAGAMTMCVRNDKVVFGVSSQQAPTAVAYDNDTAEWSVYFDGVGVVSGVSSCAPWSFDGTKCVEGARIFSSYSGCPYAKGADVNKNYQGRKDGSYCWCKITHPFESWWVYVHLYTGDCASNCPTACASQGMVGNHTSFRPSIMATVGMGE